MNTTPIKSLIIAATVCSSHAYAEENAVKKVQLSTEQLQKSLGITSWEINIPESYGDKCELRYEQYVAGKRVLILESGIIIREGETRTLLVSIRKENDTLIVYNERGGLSMLSEKPLRIVDDEVSLKGSFIDVDSEPIIQKDRIILQTWLHKMKADMTALESDSNPSKVVATKTLSIVSGGGE